jgi:ribosomal protein S15P/S13E
LADNLSNKDKHNKRNLRLMVHRQQKLLAYLRKKERSGPRWRNLVEELGVRQAMCRGEISL